MYPNALFFHFIFLSIMTFKIDRTFISSAAGPLKDAVNQKSKILQLHGIGSVLLSW
jgi:hypothetical protein